MQSLTALKDQVTAWETLQRRSDDLVELIELADDESDDVMLTQLSLDAESLSTDLSDQEFRLQLNGKHDARPAISLRETRRWRSGRPRLVRDVAANVPDGGANKPATMRTSSTSRRGRKQESSQRRSALPVTTPTDI